MTKCVFRLNQTHWKYAMRTTNGLNEERLYEDSDEDMYSDAFEGDDFDEVFDAYLVKNHSLVA